MDDSPDQPRTITELRVIAARVKVRVVGDPELADVVVEGPHQLTVEGSRALVRSDPPATEYVNEATGEFTKAVRFRFGDWLDSRRGDWRPEIHIRVPQNVAVDATVALGGVEVDSVLGSVRCQVGRGAAWLRGVEGPVEAVVSTGRVFIHGALRRGQSSVSCHRGSAQIELSPDADVRVYTLMDPGNAKVTGGSWDGKGWAFGAGTARLTVDLDLGFAEVAAVPRRTD